MVRCQVGDGVGGSQRGGLDYREAQIQGALLDGGRRQGLAAAAAAVGGSADGGDGDGGVGVEGVQGRRGELGRSHEKGAQGGRIGVRAWEHITIYRSTGAGFVIAASLQTSFRRKMGSSVILYYCGDGDGKHRFRLAPE